MCSLLLTFLSINNPFVVYAQTDAITIHKPSLGDDIRILARSPIDATCIALGYGGALSAISKEIENNFTGPTIVISNDTSLVVRGNTDEDVPQEVYESITCKKSISNPVQPLESTYYISRPKLDCEGKTAPINYESSELQICKRLDFERHAYESKTSEETTELRITALWSGKCAIHGRYNTKSKRYSPVQGQSLKAIICVKSNELDQE